MRKAAASYTWGGLCFTRNCILCPVSTKSYAYKRNPCAWERTSCVRMPYALTCTQQRALWAQKHLALKHSHYTWNLDFSLLYYQACSVVPSLGTLLFNWFNPSGFLPYIFYWVVWNYIGLYEEKSTPNMVKLLWLGFLLIIKNRIFEFYPLLS